jgi:hypothetical protein
MTTKWLEKNGLTKGSFYRRKFSTLDPAINNFFGILCLTLFILYQVCLLVITIYEEKYLGYSISKIYPEYNKLIYYSAAIFFIIGMAGIAFRTEYQLFKDKIRSLSKISNLDKKTVSNLFEVELEAQCHKKLKELSQELIVLEKKYPPYFPEVEEAKSEFGIVYQYLVYLKLINDEGYGRYL